MPFTNAQHIAPAKLNISGWANSSGSINQGSFSPSPSINTAIREGTHSIVLPASAFNADYEARFGSSRYRSDNIVAVSAGHVLNLVWRARSGGSCPQMINVWVEFYGSGGQVWQQIQYISPANTGQFETQSIPISIPEDGSVTGLKIAFQPGFVCKGETPQNFYIDKLALHDHGRDKQAGSIWYDDAPKARRAFDSGNGEITISADGAWKLNGVPFVVKGAYPDFEEQGGNSELQQMAQSLANSRANGFNTAYQINPCTGQQAAVPSGMKMVSDGSSFIRGDFTSNGTYVPAGCGWHNMALATQRFEELIDDVGDDWIAVYLDVEEYVWEEFEWQVQLVAAIRQAESNKGTHKRPVFVHCQQSSGAQRYHEIADYFEFKANPEAPDFGIRTGAEGYDFLQGPSGRALAGHPELTNPISTFSFNTPHNGSHISGDIVYGVILGGAGFSIWSDRPSLTYSSSVNGSWGRGYEQQPWWNSTENINTTLSQLDNLWPMMNAPQQNELQATFSSNAQDGWLGVTKTLRKVGNEVWGAFANRDNSQARTITVTTSEPMNAGSLVDKFTVGSSAQITGTNTLQVTLGAGKGYVGAFTVGEIVAIDYDLEITSPTGGTQANPASILPGTNHVNYQFEINTVSGVTTQTAIFERVNSDGSFTELNRQTLTPGGTTWDATPSITYTDGMLLRVSHLALDSAGAILDSAEPVFYVFEDAAIPTVRRCVALNVTIIPGNAESYSLDDLDDGEGGTPIAFHIPQQPSNGGFFAVFDSNTTLSISMLEGATEVSCGNIEIEYEI